jgi:hypothetical protein
MFGLRVPVISVVIGEGGSGGALAIGCANRNLIMENSVYYVASPEACAAILWKSRAASSQVGGRTGSFGSAHCCLSPCRHSWWCRRQHFVFLLAQRLLFAAVYAKRQNADTCTVSSSTGCPCHKQVYRAAPGRWRICPCEACCNGVD